MKRTCTDTIKSLSRYVKMLPNTFILYAVRLANSITYHMYLFRIFGKQFYGLNFGSGNAKIRNFWNIDANPRALCDIIARIDKIKLDSNSVGLIYNSHVFEHIPREQARGVLAEWYRILRPGGKLFICVPDEEILFRVYLDNLSLYHTEEGKNLVDRACFLTYGAQRNKYDYHFYGYSFATLKALLESIGFKNVQRFDRKELKIVPFHDCSISKIGDIEMSLNVEASK